MAATIMDTAVLPEGTPEGTPPALPPGWLPPPYPVPVGEAPNVDWVALREVYPESDGQPMADNTKQFDWIMTIKGGLEALFREDPLVFVAGDLLWYPVEGRPEVRVAPDALVVFGRPKGHRGAYLQFREEGVAPQVVFEVLSPGNTIPEMVRKHRFYDEYGVEEYYVYDPDRGTLDGWQRREGKLADIEEMRGWVSPRLGVRFDLEGDELRLYRPDGERFSTYLELVAQREQERQRAERLAARLRELGIDPDVVP